MKYILKHRVSISWLCLLVLPATAADDLAGTWTCHNGGITRQVTVFYPAAPARLPCKVFYSKPMENAMPRALWNSNNEDGYCERKAEEFVGRLRSMGWQCAPDPLAPGR